MLAADLASLPVDDRLSRIAGNACPSPACLFVCLAHRAGHDSCVIHQQPVTANFKQMPNDRLRLLVDAHALPIDVLRHVVECAGDGQRRPGAEHCTHQTVLRPACCVVEHGALLVRVVASLVVLAFVRGVRPWKVIITGSLDGFRAFTDVAHQAPAVSRRCVLGAGKSDVRHRATPIFIEVTGLTIGYSRWMK